MFAASTPSISWAFAWLLFTLSFAFIIACVWLDPRAPMRVKLSVCIPWALCVSQSPIWMVITGS